MPDLHAPQPPDAPHEPAAAPPASHASIVHSARIVSPITYMAEDGRARAIPKGPCLIEEIAGPAVEIVWGAKGQNCTALAVSELTCAKARGQLVMLD